MEVIKEYKNLAERETLVKEWEGKGYRMLHDNFDCSTCPKCGAPIFFLPEFEWECTAKECAGRGEINGTLIFTDEPARVNPSKTIRNPLKEIDELKARLDALEEK